MQLVTKKDYKGQLAKVVSDILMQDNPDYRLDVLFASLSQIWLRYPDMLPIADESVVFDKLQDNLMQGKLNDAVTINIYDSICNLTEDACLAKLNDKIQKLFALLPSPAVSRYKLF